LRVQQPLAQLSAAGGEGVADVLDEDEAQHQVLVLGGVHVGTQLVGRGPERLLQVVEHVRGDGTGLRSDPPMVPAISV